MRNFTLALCLLLVSGVLRAQDVPNLIPPSPEAASLLTYGNTGVNFYAGQPSFSVPIHTISVRGYQFPIALNYTSFQGVNLESLAPWVGLGWALNATGTVSRTVRGLADDTPSYGYLSLNDVDYHDTTVFIGTLKDYGDGVLDGEPDKFFFSVNGLSGSFFLARDGSVVLKTKSNVKISHSQTNPITSFTITDNGGFSYIFSEQEKTKSVGLGQSPAGILEPATSWYLKTIQDQRDSVLLTFSYHDLTTLRYTTRAPSSEKRGAAAFLEQDMSYTTHHTTGKRVAEIEYDGGKIKFNKSTADRLDYMNDKYLESIEVIGGDNVPIKKYVLNYSYLDPDDPSGEVPITSISSGVQFNGLSIGDYQRRLKLNSVQEISGDLTDSLPPYLFEYNMEYTLPHRFSYASDHWGFFNGQTGNSSPEPYYRYKYYTPSGISGTPHYVQAGSANKEADSEYTKTGVLKRVTYPTGGSTTFEMEGNQAVSLKLPNALVPIAAIDVPVNGVNVNFTVSKINQPFIPISISGTVSSNGSVCGINGSLYKVGVVDPVKSFTITPQSGVNTHEIDLYDIIEDGDYYLNLAFQTGCATYQASDKLQLRYSNETLLINKPVGGLRVKSITDHDGISRVNDVKRNFFYNEDGETGNSTGRVVSVPRYAYQRVAEVIIDYNACAANDPTCQFKTVPDGMTRTIKSNYPLVTTNGSFVGYGKVTVMTHDGQETGKSDYEFTTAEDYPDFLDPYYETPLSGETYFSIAGYGAFEIFPFPKTDDRDFLRGLMEKQTNYRYNSGSYEKVSETINEYAFTYSFPLFNGEGIDAVIDNIDSVAANTEYSSVKGMLAKTYYENQDPNIWSKITFKYYNIYTGRVDLQRTINRQYSTTSINDYIEATSRNYWDDLGTGSGDGYFNVSRTQTIDSEGDTLETRYFFPYDSLSWMDTGVNNALMAKNMTSAMLEQQSLEGDILLSTLRNIYSGSVNNYLPSQVSAAKGSNPLESRVRYHKYDSFGNALEVSQEDGMHISYLWGYNKTLPVAKIDNATYAQIEQAFTADPNLSVGDLDLGAGGLTSAMEAVLRSISGTMVTTIDYEWGVGVKSQTDPNGLTTTYEYDSFGRLKWVKDPSGNIINAYTYNYKGQ